HKPGSGVAALAAERRRPIGQRAPVDEVCKADVVPADRHGHERRRTRHGLDLRREHIRRLPPGAGDKRQGRPGMRLRVEVRIRIHAPFAGAAERVAVRAHSGRVAVPERDVAGAGRGSGEGRCAGREHQEDGTETNEPKKRKSTHEWASWVGYRPYHRLDVTSNAPWMV